MNLNDILESWNDDCVIGSDLSEESIRTPTLHCKYLQMLSVAKLELKRAENQQKRLLKDKWIWYNGKMSEEEMKERKWEPDPFNGLKIMKGDMNYYYESDPEIQRSEERIVYFKTIIDTLKDIVDSLKWRHQTIKNCIDWKRFEVGG